jgi:hypothetical protein
MTNKSLFTIFKNNSVCFISIILLIPMTNKSLFTIFKNNSVCFISIILLILVIDNNIIFYFLIVSSIKVF